MTHYDELEDHDMEQAPLPLDIEGRDGTAGRGRRLTDTPIELACERVGYLLRAADRNPADGNAADRAAGLKRTIEHYISAFADTAASPAALSELRKAVEAIATEQRWALVAKDGKDPVVLGKAAAGDQEAAWVAASSEETTKRKLDLATRIVSEGDDPDVKSALETRLLSLEFGDATMLEPEYIHRDELAV